MTNLAASFRSLTKNNNGFFKSQKQADFLISQTDDNREFAVSESVYGKSYLDVFHVDEKGVTSVTRTTKGSDKVIWQRDISVSFEDAMKAAEARQDAKDRATRIHSAARSIAEKAHKLEEAKAMAVVRFMDSVDTSNPDDVKALTAYSDKISKVISNGLEIASMMRDKADSMF